MAPTLLAVHVICIAYLVAVRGVMGSLCEESGECGLNGICNLEGDSSFCTCPPGFNFLDTKNTSKGCSQDAEQLNRCGAAAEMQYVGRFDWPGNDYDHKLMNETACNQACLEDCFCTVAIYADLSSTENCWKKALPLIDGRASSTRKAFVKVYEESISKPREEGRVVVLVLIIDVEE